MNAFAQRTSAIYKEWRLLRHTCMAQVSKVTGQTTIVLLGQQPMIGQISKPVASYVQQECDGIVGRAWLFEATGLEYE